MMYTNPKNRSPISSATEDSLFGMLKSGLIDQEQTRTAFDALNNSTDDISIGYELEVTADIVSESHTFPKHPLVNNKLVKNDWLHLSIVASEIGYEEDLDELFEIASPPSTHPYSLFVTQLGVIKSGLIPKSPKSMITKHVSLGVPEGNQSHSEYIDILRTVEQLGASNPSRLLSPITENIGHYGTKIPQDLLSYACKGVAGVHIVDNRETSNSKGWIGKNQDRIEFRSLQYRSPEQLSIALDGLYYIVKAMRAPRQSTLFDIYSTFSDEDSEIKDSLDLPDPQIGIETDWTDPGETLEYLLPFAQLMTNPQQSKALRDNARRAILNTREELSMGHIYTPFENPGYFKLRRHPKPSEDLMYILKSNPFSIST